MPETDDVVYFEKRARLVDNIAETLKSGAGDDIWYDASYYADRGGGAADRIKAVNIDAVQKSMEAASEMLLGIKTRMEMMVDGLRQTTGAIQSSPVDPKLGVQLSGVLTHAAYILNEMNRHVIVNCAIAKDDHFTIERMIEDGYVEVRGVDGDDVDGDDVGTRPEPV